MVRLTRHCFPWFWEELEAVEDPREDPHYAMRQVLGLGVLMFACRIRSLRALDRVSDDARFRDNWCTFTRAKTDTVVCSHQMTNVLAQTDWEELGAIPVHAIKDLVRHKQLAPARLLGHVMMVSDGTGIFASSEFHCDQCLTQHHQDGSVTYLHNVLELKVVGWNGWAFSVMTEPQLNPEDGHYDKQDCETKAFKRVLPRLKQAFPREPIVHLLDSLYCSGPMFRAIEAVAHKFICVFKPGSIPTLYEEALTLLTLNPHNTIKQTLRREGHRVTRIYRWVNDLEHQGVRLAFVMCQETVNGHTSTFAFLTDFVVDRDNVIIIADGGRLRWKIENEGFNEQKTGYALEHFCDCKDLNVMLGLYVLLQIAHMLMQLLARSNLIAPVPTLTFLAARLLEDLRNAVLPEDLFAPHPPRMQVRFAKAPP